MCELCGTDEEKRAGEAKARKISDDLNELAIYYALLGNGNIKPHTSPSKVAGERARRMIRILAEEWL